HRQPTPRAKVHENLDENLARPGPQGKVHPQKQGLPTPLVVLALRVDQGLQETAPLFVRISACKISPCGLTLPFTSFAPSFPRGPLFP
ncbi:hypothetical protein CSW29_07545, partial [Thermus scotoductus]